MDQNEQISLFSRLLEIVIRHALRKKNEENTNLNGQFTKPGSKLNRIDLTNQIVLFFLKKLFVKLLKQQLLNGDVQHISMIQI